MVSQYSLRVARPGHDRPEPRILPELEVESAGWVPVHRVIRRGVVVVTGMRKR